VGHRRSGGRVYLHMEPYSTLDQILTPCALHTCWGGNVAARQAAGSLGGVMRVQGAGLSRRFGPFWGTGALEGGFTLIWPRNLNPPWTRSLRLAPCGLAMAAGQAAGALGGVMGRAGSRQRDVQACSRPPTHLDASSAHFSDFDGFSPFSDPQAPWMSMGGLERQ
jgi:hypothetical protein